MKKLIAFILTVGMLITFASCADKGKGVNTKVDGLGRTYIQSFESFKEMFNCQFDNFYGKIDLSADYKTEGNTSAEIKVNTLTDSALAPKLTVDIFNDGYGYDFRDFGMVDYIGFSMKNANDYASTVHFYVTGENGDNLVESYCALGAGETGEFRFKIDRVLATIRHDYAKNVCFDFDISTGTWYLDGLYIEKAYKPIVITEKDFSSDVLLDFNDNSDVNYLLPSATFTSTIYSTTLTPFGGNVNKGGNSLKVTFDKVTNIGRDEEIQPRAYYSGFRMGNAFMENFDFSRLNGKNLSVDVFNATEKEQKFIIEITDDFDAVYDKVVILQPNVWQTVTLTSEELNASTLTIKSVSQLSFYFDTHVFNGSSVFYFDNIVLKEALK